MPQKSLKKPSVRAASRKKAVVSDAPVIEAELAVDVVDNPEAVYVYAAVAGIKPGDLAVTLADTTLTIRGSRASWAVAPAKKYVVRECHAGVFSRSIMLPFTIAADSINAILEKGLLTIIVQRPTTAQ